MSWPLYLQAVVPRISHPQGAGNVPAASEGRVIVLLFLGVCAMIAVFQLVPALRSIFKISNETEEKSAKTGNISEGRN